MDARRMRETDLYFLHQLFKLIQRFFKIAERIVIDLFSPADPHQLRPADQSEHSCPPRVKNRR